MPCDDQSHGWKCARCKYRPRNQGPQIFRHRRDVVRSFGATPCTMPRDLGHHDEEQEPGDARAELQKDEPHESPQPLPRVPHCSTFREMRRRPDAGAVVVLLQLFRETCTPSADSVNLSPTSVEMSLITTPCSFLR
jgi:hypothetical protein